jgi:hypothetical protein
VLENSSQLGLNQDERGEVALSYRNLRVRMLFRWDGNGKLKHSRYVGGKISPASNRELVRIGCCERTAQKALYI